MARSYSWRSVHRLYNVLRDRYYLDAAPPLCTPPRAESLRWAWMSNRTGEWACTHFDQDGEPETVKISIELRAARHTLQNVLLHELSHMRNPAASCRRGSRWWQEETVRLASLKALHL